VVAKKRERKTATVHIVAVADNANPQPRHHWCGRRQREPTTSAPLVRSPATRTHNLGTIGAVADNANPQLRHHCAVANNANPQLRHHCAVANNANPQLRHHCAVANNANPQLRHHCAVANNANPQLRHHCAVANNANPQLRHRGASPRPPALHTHRTCAHVRARAHQPLHHGL